MARAKISGRRRRSHRILEQSIEWGREAVSCGGVPFVGRDQGKEFARLAVGPAVRPDGRLLLEENSVRRHRHTSEAVAGNPDRRNLPGVDFRPRKQVADAFLDRARPVHRLLLMPGRRGVVGRIGDDAFRDTCAVRTIHSRFGAAGAEIASYDGFADGQFPPALMQTPRAAAQRSTSATAARVLIPKRVTPTAIIWVTVSRSRMPPDALIWTAP